MTYARRRNRGLHRPTTALPDLYRDGRLEELIGKTIEGSRDEAFLLTAGEFSGS
jgi:hypothetical protein